MERVDYSALFLFGKEVSVLENNVRLEEKLDDIKDRLIVIETKMAMINGVEKDSTEALQSVRSAHKRLDGVEDSITWLWRTVVGGLVVAAITFLFTK